MTCIICKKGGHLAKDCWYRENKGSSQSFGNNQTKNFTSGSNKIFNKKHYENSQKVKTYNAKRIYMERNQTNQNRITGDGVHESVTLNAETTPKAVNKIALSDTHTASSISTRNKTEKVDTNKTVLVDFGIGPIKCIIDSGAEISVVKPDMLPVDGDQSESANTSVKLLGAFGGATHAKMCNVKSKLVKVDGLESKCAPIFLTCAVTPDLNGNTALITPSDYENLLENNSVFVPDVKLLHNTPLLCNNDVKDTDLSMLLETKLVSINDSNSVNAGESLNLSDLFNIDLTNESLATFKDAQLSDKTLSSCWDNVKVEGSKFEKSKENELLYRNTVIAGTKVLQLVVPQCKRDIIIKAAHDSQWAMHFGADKTLKRIEAYFFWPKMKNDIVTYTKGCSSCQKRARVTKLDRVPIKPVPHSVVAFEQVNIDLIGPIEPSSSRGHKYILCLIDNCTRWAEASPLKGLTAKETCDALLTMFTRIGI
ncbi:MAG: hypothetical protein ACHQ1D_11525, partial [Nitrososphaerales archaeon]